MFKAKTLLLCFILFILLGIASSPAVSNAGSSCPWRGRWSGIVLYEHANFTGRTLILRYGYYASDLSRYGFNDVVSSVCVYGPYRFLVCEHANFQGRCSIFTGSDPYLGDNAVGNDRASSVIWAR